MVIWTTSEKMWRGHQGARGEDQTTEKSAESKRDTGKSATPTSTAETETPVGEKAVLMWEGKEERKEPKGTHLLFAPHGEQRRGRAARACWISYLIKHQLIGVLKGLRNETFQGFGT